MSIIVHFKIQLWYERKKTLICQRKVKTSDGKIGRVHFYIGQLKQEE